jgi:hypothetical protein
MTGQRARKHISIDLGHCREWSLQQANPESTIFTRCLEADEVESIKEAIGFCRKNVLSPTYRLLYGAYSSWRLAVDTSSKSDARHQLPALSESLLGSLIGWLLIWRLIIDQSDHEMSQRFGKNSDERAKLKQAKRDAYDQHQGYRLAEALRNRVQHQEMPPLNLSHSNRLDSSSGNVVTEISYGFPVSWLLDSDKCPRTLREEFASTPDAIISAPAMADDAMVGMQSVLLTLAVINIPEFTRHVNRLRKLFSEVHPGVPVLLHPGDNPEVSVQIKMQRMDDLLMIVRDAPVGEPYGHSQKAIEAG